MKILIIWKTWNQEILVWLLFPARKFLVIRLGFFLRSQEPRFFSIHQNIDWGRINVFCSAANRQLEGWQWDIISNWPFFLLSLSLSRILLWKIISDSNTFISFCKVLFKMELHVYFMYFWGNLHLFLTFSTMEILLKSVFHHKLFLALSKKVFPPKEKFSSMHIVHCTSPPSPSPPSFLIPYQSYCTAADLAEDESF